MRLLLIPHTGLKTVQADSNYLLYLDLARYLVRRGHFCYMLMPDHAREKVTKEPGIMYVYRSVEADYYTDYFAMDANELIRLFSRRSGSDLIDGAVTSKAGMIPYLQAVLSDFIRCRDVPCVHIEPAVFDEESGAHFGGDMQMALTALGYAYGIPVFLTHYEKERAVALCRRYISSGVIRRIWDRCLVKPVGLDCDYIDKVVEGVEKREKFTLFFGARLNIVKQPDRVFRLYDRFYAAGRPIGIEVTTPSVKLPFFKERQALLKGRPEIHVEFAVPRAAYLKTAASCHAFVCWSTSESFPVGFWEQLYLGLPGLFPRRAWAVKQLPAGYPYLFRDEAEAYAMLLDIYENYEAHRVQMEGVHDFIRKEFDVRVVYAAIERRLLEEVHARRTYVMTKGLAKLIAESTQNLATPFSLRTVIELMEKYGRVWLVDRGQRAHTFRYCTDYDIHRHLLKMGFVDQARARVPVYERVADGQGPAPA